MHAASLKAVEAIAATSTAASRAARAEAGPTDTTTAVTDDDIPREFAVVQQRAEAAERDAREHARRANEMEKRAAAATEQIKELKHVAGVSFLATEEKNRQQAFRLVSCTDVDTQIRGSLNDMALLADTQSVPTRIDVSRHTSGGVTVEYSSHKTHNARFSPRTPTDNQSGRREKQAPPVPWLEPLVLARRLAQRG